MIIRFPFSEPPDASTACSAGHQFVALDGMRGAAALVVVVWHAAALFGYGPASGYLAVDLFFVLSGFVLAHAYDPRLNVGMTTAGFMRIRFIRFYPLYLLGIGLMVTALVAALLVGARTNWTFGRLLSTLALNLAFLPAPPRPGDANLYPLDVPAWSLAFEIVVNVVFAATWAALLGARRLGLLLVVTALGLATLAWRNGDLNLGAQWSGLAGGLLRVVYSFFMGVVLRRSRFLAAAVVDAAWLIGILLILLWVPVPPTWRPTFDLVNIVVVFPLLVALGAAARPRWLKPLFVPLGRASYAIYVLHVPLLAIVLGALPHLRHGPLPAGTLAGTLFAGSVLAVALVADRVYDLPTRRWLLRTTGRGRSDRAAVV